MLGRLTSRSPACRADLGRHPVNSVARFVVRSFGRICAAVVPLDSIGPAVQNEMDIRVLRLGHRSH
jgi:hypothetical protein